MSATAILIWGLTAIVGIATGVLGNLLTDPVKNWLARRSSTRAARRIEVLDRQLRLVLLFEKSSVEFTRYMMEDAFVVVSNIAFALYTWSFPAAFIVILLNDARLRIFGIVLLYVTHLIASIFLGRAVVYGALTQRLIIASKQPVKYQAKIEGDIARLKRVVEPQRVPDSP